MTFKERVIELLYKRGMFQDQAEEVLELAMADPANEAMKDRWNDHIEGYPPQTLTVLWFSVKRVALDYIIKNCPQAWFRPMFEDAPSSETPARTDDQELHKKATPKEIEAGYRWAEANYEKG